MANNCCSPDGCNKMTNVSTCPFNSRLICRCVFAPISAGGKRGLRNRFAEIVDLVRHAERELQTRERTGRDWPEHHGGTEVHFLFEWSPAKNVLREDPPLSAENRRDFLQSTTRYLRAARSNRGGFLATSSTRRGNRPLPTTNATPRSL